MHPMAMRYLIDGEERDDPALVLWTEPNDDHHASLLEIPDMGYVIVRHGEPFTDGQPLDLGIDYIELGRGAAGRFAVALIAALINNSEQIIAQFIDQRTAVRSSESEQH
jgi:hypothetical protein